MRACQLLAVAAALAALGPAFAGDTTVQSANGLGGRSTRPFSVADNWELQWEAKGGLFQAFLHDADSGKPLDVIANQPGTGKGASYQRKGGRYYLTINALGEWTLKVVQLEASQ